MTFLTISKITKQLCIIGGLLTVLYGCSTSRYSQKEDTSPSRIPTASELIDAVPRYEPKSRGGNKSTYTVLGKSYNVMNNAEGFKQTGIASYYGEKFHGHLTSNGERYNMYSMSAAHKNLPLPTYVKVTNLSNNKSTIVRVNDRGPFHHNRIIDLSYSAAYKLDMIKTGTAKVHIEAITDFNNNKIVKTKPLKKEKPFSAVKTIEEKAIQMPAVDNGSFYIQVFATESQAKAKEIATALGFLYQQDVNYHQQLGIYRIKMGPFDDKSKASEAANNLNNSGYPNAFVFEQMSPHQGE